jgi:hypothetical protein
VSGILEMAAWPGVDGTIASAGAPLVIGPPTLMLPACVAEGVHAAGARAAAGDGVPRDGVLLRGRNARGGENNQSWRGFLRRSFLVLSTPVSRR